MFKTISMNNLIAFSTGD